MWGTRHLWRLKETTHPACAQHQAQPGWGTRICGGSELNGRRVVGWGHAPLFFDYWELPRVFSTAVIVPKRPWLSSWPAAVKYSVLAGPEVPPLPKESPQRPWMVMGVLLEVSSRPLNSPVTGS